MVLMGKKKAEALENSRISARGAWQAAHEPFSLFCAVNLVKGDGVRLAGIVIGDLDPPIIVDENGVDEGLYEALLAFPVLNVQIPQSKEEVLDMVSCDADAGGQL